MTSKIDIVGIGKLNNLPEVDDDIFFTLEEYLEIARRIVLSYTKKFGESLVSELLSNDDAMANIAYVIMMADWRSAGLNKDEKGSHRGYRKSAADYMILDILKRRALGFKHNLYSLDWVNPQGVAVAYNVEDQTPPVIDLLAKNDLVEKIDKLVARKEVSAKGVRYLKKKYIEGKSRKQIMKEEGINNHQAYCQLMNETIKNIRCLLNKENY